MVDPTNHRAAKANDSYYMLRKTVSPTVIVECGFLSNEKECKKLQEAKYQDKIVEAILSGNCDICTDAGEQLAFLVV